MRIGCLDDLVRAVNDSCNSKAVQLVGTQNGEVIVPMFNWSEFFEDAIIKRALKRNKPHASFSFYIKSSWEGFSQECS